MRGPRSPRQPDVSASMAMTLAQRDAPMTGLTTAEIRDLIVGAPVEPVVETGAISGDDADIRRQVQIRLVEELRRADRPEPAAVRARVAELVTQIGREAGIDLGISEAERLIAMIADDVLGLGPLERLLDDPSVSEIMVNGPDEVYVERAGRVIETDVRFDDETHLRRVIDRIVSRVGRRVDESSPMVDARLQDGSRVNVVLPPVALRGPTMTIRKFSNDPMRASDLVNIGTMTQHLALFLEACVGAHVSMVISGGTGSGKTTLLNALSGFIPEWERIVTIEDAAELQLKQRHVVAMETRPPNVEGRGRITVRELVINSLRMRPDRILVGECRGAEALDMLQALNTGHDGSLTTVHANNPRQAIARIESMALMAGSELPHAAIREQIAGAIQIVVHVSRLADGRRRVTAVSEVRGVKDEAVVLEELFRWSPAAAGGQGGLVPTGVAPLCLEKINDAAQPGDDDIFAASMPLVGRPAPAAATELDPDPVRP